MKKLLSLFALMMALVSCTDEVSFNNPGFQALKNNLNWRANDARATINTDGSITITGRTSTEIVTLRISGSEIGTYLLGEDISSFASYQATFGNTSTFMTGPDLGDGQIVLDSYDEVNKTVSGSFRFNAISTDQQTENDAVVNFQEGVFYKIPVVPGI